MVGAVVYRVSARTLACVRRATLIFCWILIFIRNIDSNPTITITVITVTVIITTIVTITDITIIITPGSDLVWDFHVGQVVTEIQTAVKPKKKVKVKI